MTTVKTEGITEIYTGLSPFLKGWWKINDGSGDVLADSSGKNNWLKCPVAVSANFWGTAGRGTFNGSTDRFMLFSEKFEFLLQLGNTKSGVQPTFIISARIRVTGFSSVAQIVGNLTRNAGTEGSHSGVGFNLTTSARAQTEWSPQGAGASQYPTSSGVLSINTDYHLVFGFDPTNSRFHWYINGSL